MENPSTFSYNYSAKENNEVQQIRKKYLPASESKLEELRRLDAEVQTSGMVEALSAGIGGALVFGLGLCLAMEIIGSGLICIILGVLFGMVGIVGMLAAYPINRKIFKKTKNKLAPRILEISAELTGQSDTSI